jgi:peptidyl-prolyl cis-trans isomerase SurA
MRKLVLSCLATGFTAFTLQAQTLFTYGGMPVSKQEFLRVYQKNSINKKTDFSEPALREYLDLYSLFKMKVHEAEGIKLDTVQSIAAELDNYRHQLSKNYLTDKEVTNKLITEAYSRMKDEVHVAHILISCSQSAPAEDTAKAYAKIDSIYKAITKGKADFSKMASEYSDDRGTRAGGGDIGYLTALQTVYPFENAIYSTPVGKVSAPFRTQFGYHIVKVLDRRPNRGEVQVAHILVATPRSKGDAGVDNARNRADSIEAMLRQGVPFDTLVARYSEDKLSKSDFGVLQPFGAGRMVPAFEDAAFALKKPGDVSAPVQTEYGFHIIRLIRKIPLKPFDSLRDNLARRIENDGRAQIARDQFMARIKHENNFKEYPANLKPLTDRIMSLPDTGMRANTFRSADFAGMNEPLFELGGNKYLQSDFIRFAESLTHGRINGPRGAVINDIYKLYVERTVNDFEEHHLAETNTDFRNLMEEYRNGIMLFELMDRNVWGKASRDTVGLKGFYAQHANKWQWEPGFTGTVYHFKDEASMKKVQAILEKNADAKDEEIYKAINIESNPDAVNIQHGHFEFTHFKDVPQNLIVRGKVSSAVRGSDGSFTIVRADNVFNQPTPKTLDEARGYAVAEYQDSLEKSWNAELRAKYPVKVDEKVFASMVK